jgi:hypothetical protein
MERWPTKRRRLAAGAGRTRARAVGNHGEALGGGGVDEVGVAAGDGADFFGVGCGPEAGGHGGVAEAEGAGGEELLRAGRILWFGFSGHHWADQHFECAALHLLGVAGIDEVARGEDGRACGERLGLPEMGKAEVER